MSFCFLWKFHPMPMTSQIVIGKSDGEHLNELNSLTKETVWIVRRVWKQELKIKNAFALIWQRCRGSTKMWHFEKSLQECEWEVKMWSVWRVFCEIVGMRSIFPHVCMEKWVRCVHVEMVSQNLWGGSKSVEWFAFSWFHGNGQSFKMWLLCLCGKNPQKNVAQMLSDWSWDLRFNVWLEKCASSWKSKKSCISLAKKHHCLKSFSQHFWKTRRKKLQPTLILTMCRLFCRLSSFKKCQSLSAKANWQCKKKKKNGFVIQSLVFSVTEMLIVLFKSKKQIRFYWAER